MDGVQKKKTRSRLNTRQLDRVRAAARSFCVLSDRTYIHIIQVYAKGREKNTLTYLCP